MEKRRVVITGLGTVNPIGNTVAESWAAAKEGKCGIGPITQFDASGFKCKLAGEVKGFDPEAVVDKKGSPEDGTLHRSGARALPPRPWPTAAWTWRPRASEIGCIVSSGIGGLPTIEEQHSRGLEKGMEKVSPYFVPMAIANMAAAQIAIRFGLKGMCTCPVTACAGGTNAVGDAFHRIRDGYEPIMVCGGAESCISPLGIGGFTSMKALSTAEDPDAASLPFDARRGGFVMGEGGGILVLESLEHAQARGAKIYAEVVGYGANCDAYHFTAPAPGGVGAIGCMKQALADGQACPGAGGPHQRPRHRHPHERQLRDGRHPCGVRQPRQGDRRGLHQEHDRPPAGRRRRCGSRLHGAGPAGPVCTAHHPLCPARPGV